MGKRKLHSSVVRFSGDDIWKGLSRRGVYYPIIEAQVFEYKDGKIVMTPLSKRIEDGKMKLNGE